MGNPWKSMDPRVECESSEMLDGEWCIGGIELNVDHGSEAVVSCMGQRNRISYKEV